MTKKIVAFSFIELIIMLTIVSILTAIAIPSYNSHATKIKIAKIFTTLNYYRIYVVDLLTNDVLTNNALINNRTSNGSSNYSTDLIVKLSFKKNAHKPEYIIQAKINTAKLNIPQINNKPLLINLIGTIKDENVIWQCQIQNGYNIHTPEPCVMAELNSI